MSQIAIKTLLRRLPNLRLAVPAEELVWRPSLLLLGLSKMPVTYEFYHAGMRRWTRKRSGHFDNRAVKMRPIFLGVNCLTLA